MQPSISKELAVLDKCQVFSQVDKESLSKLAGASLLRSCRAGEILFRTGDQAEGFYVIASGEIEVYRSVDSGREQMLHVLGPGEVCGSVPVFQGSRFPASARTRGAASFLYIPGAVFLDLSFENPQILLDMLAVMSNRLRQFAVQVESLSLHDVPKRLIAYLRQLAAVDGAVTLDCTKTELAIRLGTVPETLSRAFNRLSRSGQIDIDGDLIHIRTKS